MVCVAPGLTTLGLPHSPPGSLRRSPSHCLRPAAPEFKNGTGDSWCPTGSPGTTAQPGVGAPLRAPSPNSSQMERVGGREAADLSLLCTSLLSLREISSALNVTPGSPENRNLDSSGETESLLG